MSDWLSFDSATMASAIQAWQQIGTESERAVATLQEGEQALMAAGAFGGDSTGQQAKAGYEQQAIPLMEAAAKIAPAAFSTASTWNKDMVGNIQTEEDNLSSIRPGTGGGTEGSGTRGSAPDA